MKLACQRARALSRVAITTFGGVNEFCIITMRKLMNYFQWLILAWRAPSRLDAQATDQRVPFLEEVAL
jgi:hypothetical protein